MWVRTKVQANKQWLGLPLKMSLRSLQSGHPRDSVFSEGNVSHRRSFALFVYEGGKSNSTFLSHTVWLWNYGKQVLVMPEYANLTGSTQGEMDSDTYKLS